MRAPPPAAAAAALAAHLPAADLAPLAGALLARSAADGPESPSNNPYPEPAQSGARAHPAWAMALGLRLAEAVLERGPGVKVGLGIGPGPHRALPVYAAEEWVAWPAEQHGLVAGVVGVLLRKGSGSGFGPGRAPSAEASVRACAAMAGTQHLGGSEKNPNPHPDHDLQESLHGDEAALQAAAERCMLLALGGVVLGWRQAMCGHPTLPVELHALENLVCKA